MKKISFANNRTSSGRDARSLNLRVMQKPRAHGHRHVLCRVLALVALSLVSTGMWAADYVFMSGDNYIIINNSGAITTTNTFNPSTCLWSGTSGGTFANNGKTLKYSQTSSTSWGTTTFDSPTFNTTSTDVPANISDDGNMSFSARYQSSVLGTSYRDYYIQLDGSSLVSSTTSNANNVKAYEYKTLPASTKEPKITGSPNTYSETGQTGNFNHTDALYYSSCDGYSTGDANYYWYEDALHETAPSSTAGFTYAWSLSSNVSGYASVDNAGKVTYNTLVPEPTVSAELICTATHTSGAKAIATYPLTFTNDGVLAKPTIEITPNGNTATVTITGEEGTTIYYTVDGNDPSAASSHGTSPVTLTDVANQTVIKAYASKTGYSNSVVAVNQFITSGVSGNIVILNDYEDHRWTYYAGVDESVDGGNYNTNYAGKMYSPDPRNVKITYQANGGAVSIDESETEFVYYKTIEKVGGTYKYQVISNPFSKRPTGKGFGGWQIISGGDYIQNKSNNDVLALDEELTLTGLDNNYTANCTSAEIVLQATWVNATIVRNTTSGLSETGTYETNLVVLSQNYTNTIAPGYPCTIMMVEPDGSADYRASATFSGYVTPVDLHDTGKTTKIEFAHWTPNNGINPQGRNFTIGRGMIMDGTARTLYGSNTRAAMNQVLKVESGTFSNYRGCAAAPTSHTKQIVVFGNDYDRANNNDNTKLSITGSIYGLATDVNLGLTDITKELFHITTKSGKFYPDPSLTNASYNNSFYLFDYSQNNNCTRTLVIEGGEFGHIAGGANSTSNDNTVNSVVNLKIRMKGGTVNGSIFGGAAQYNCAGSKQFVFTGGTVKGWIAGGSNGYASATQGSVTGYSYVYIGGNTQVNSNGDETVRNAGVGGTVYAAGCGQSSTATSGRVALGTNVVVADKAYVERGVYGGGSFGYCPTDKTSNIYITGGEVGGNAGAINRNGNNYSYSSDITGGVYGGACQNSGGAVNIYMTGGTVNGGLYGGSNVSGTINQNVKMVITGGQVGTSSNNANIHGGGYGSSTKVSGDVDLQLGADNAPLGAAGVVVYGDVYGGSAEGMVNTSTTNHTNVTLNAGTVNGNIFGGGLGVKDGAAADVNGNVTVTVNGGSLNIGGVFGCNNQNGTPKGTVAVTVNHTNPSEYDSNGNVTKYAINAVYGGGNQIAFAGKPVVHIVNCDCSIKEVYGGGNAADVGSDETTTNPHTDATDVTIDGGEIDYAFGGGNGSGTGNPGANVKGNSNLTIGGGTINHAFGGSNTLGDVYGNANVTLEDNNDDCPISIGEVYGGANKAPMTGKPMLTIGCLSGRLENVYGGSKAVDVNSDIVLNITSGQFGKVFGGNNESGEVKGSITVNVDETDCHPIVIDELYAGGNMAAYSTPSGKSEPTINVISCSHIGRVFGGGYGATAVVTGDPVVNINQIPGKYDPDDQDESDGYSSNTSSKLGTIGEVFGGGNAAEVVGNTTVNIGTIAKNKHISGEDLSSEYDVGANITGNVYGGGNQANVTGKTNVQIGPTE